MSIWTEIMELGIPFDNHESDLYIPDTPETREIVRRHGHSFEPFTSQIDGKRWLDVPFAYEPWWERRTGRTNPRSVHTRGPYQPKTGQRCHCRPGIERDNCPDCEGTGWRIDFSAIRSRAAEGRRTPGHDRADASRANPSSSHTPGPWELETEDSHGQAVLGSDGILTADCSIIGFAHNNHLVRGEEVCRANALLISAAPELLEACETAFANLENAYSSEHIVIKRLRKAIAKARGGR